MGRLKCRWDRMVMPPEAVGRMRKNLLKISFIVSSVPIALGILLIAIFLLLWDNTDLIMLSFTLITAGIMIMGLMLMTASFINNKKYHFGAILFLKNISLEDATLAMRSFLEMKGIEYELERPKGWSYRGYLSPPKVAFYMKKEFFIGIHYFSGPEKKIIRQIKMMYMSSIWEEALIFQKEMDEYFHRIGLAQPYDKRIHMSIKENQ